MINILKDEMKRNKITKKKGNGKDNIICDNPINTFILDYAKEEIKRLEEKGIKIPKDLFGKEKVEKEMTENIAAVYHLFSFLTKRTLPSNLSKDNERVLCLCVGDGKNPQTGLLFSGLTNWKVLSVDPIMKKKWVEQKDVKNLKCVNGYIECIDFDKIKRNDLDMIVIVGVHCHANLDLFWKDLIVKFDLPMICLSIPCCTGYSQTLKDVLPEVNLVETGILSVKNKVLIWARGFPSLEVSKPMIKKPKIIK
jgi:hypothetical protein